MRSTFLLAPAMAAAVALTPVAAYAQAKPARPGRIAPNAPKSVGKFDDWQAATHTEAGQLVCYAFSRAQSSSPNVPGRGDVVLSVTQRGNGRDAVAMSAGFAYAQGAEVEMAVDKDELPFYTAARSAFARDGAAAVKAFIAGSKAIVKSPGPRAVTVSDTFSLRGFTAAYTAVNKACPAK